MRVGNVKRALVVVTVALLFIVSLGLYSFAANYITLGAAISLTGKKSRTGKLYVDSYKFAVERINKTGGIKVGGKTYKLRLKLYDDQSSPTISSRFVEKLVSEDKVNFLLGPYSSGITIPDSLVARRYHIPMIEGGGASGKIFNKGNKYIFGTLPAAGDYFKSTLEFLKQAKPFPKRLAILYADDKFDISVAQGAKKTAEKLGFDLVVYEKYPAGASDFTSILTKIKGAKAQAVLVAGHSEESINFVQQAKELNVSPMFLSLTVGPTEADFRKALGKDANYIFGVAPWSPQMNFKGYLFKNTQEFIKAFKAKYGYMPDYHNASGFADVAIYKDAIQRAGSLNPEKVRDAIAKTNLDTIYGHIEFKPNGQIKGSTVMLQIQNGKVYQVYPHGVRKPVYPVPPWNKR